MKEVYGTVACSESISLASFETSAFAVLHPSCLSLSANPFSQICVGFLNHPLMIPRLSETASSTFPAKAG